MPDAVIKHDKAETGEVVKLSIVGRSCTVYPAWGRGHRLSRAEGSSRDLGLGVVAMAAWKLWEYIV